MHLVRRVPIYYIICSIKLEPTLFQVKLKLIMNNLQNNSFNEVKYITEEDVKIIITNCGYANADTIIEKHTVHYASDKMIGFLAEYLKLQIYITTNNEQRILSFFVKATPKNNAGKAKMVKELDLFEKELQFHDVIKRNIEVPGLKPWSAQFVACLHNAAIVFEDLSALQYTMRSRHERFDQQHTLQALQALARFHACTIIFEEMKTKELQRPYRINDQYEKNMGKAGYSETDSWFIQCRNGALEAVKTFSKYLQNKDLMRIIEKRWNVVFNFAVSLADASPEYRNVVCHRDLWNNNILFHYKTLEDNSAEPDGCVFVDFAVARYSPPAGDVMQLLHCNLSPQFRKKNLKTFLNYYYDNLDTILKDNNISITDFITRDQFMKSAKEQNLWGLVTHASLVQSFWVDDDMTTKMFEDSVQFHEIMMRDKATFIKNMMENDDGYKKVVMEIFEEFIESYLLDEDLFQKFIPL